MERNVQKNCLINLVAAAVMFIALLLVSAYANSLAGRVASVFLGVTVLVAFISWFQMRLAENERLEKFEIDELARSRGDSTLFETKDSEVFPAKRSREQFERFFVPGFSVLLCLLEAIGAWLLWKWTGQFSSGIVMERALPALAVFAIISLLLFLLGRFSVTIARLQDERLLRPSASFLLAGAYISFLAALGVAGFKAGFPTVDFYIARALSVLLGLMAAELLITLLLEIYRPRLKGRVTRPLYDSRLSGLLGQPEGLFTTAAQALDYQFGFKVSETWLFKLLQQSLPALVLTQLAVLLLSTCVVFVDAGEQAIVERCGKPVAGGALLPGAHLKLPWPFEKVYRFRTDQIQSFSIGYTPDTASDAEQIISWTRAHNQEQNFLVANHETTTVTNQTADLAETNDTLKAPPVSLITVSIPVHYQISNVMDWAYRNTEPTNLLADLATREVVRYLASVDLNDIMSRTRLEAANVLRDRIQSAADTRQLGVKIVFVGLEDIHPPTKVAGDYEKVVGAQQSFLAAKLDAQAEAIRTNSLAGAFAFTITNVAEATRHRFAVEASARAALFTDQIPGYEAAPSVYRQRAYFQTFAAATANSRKYIVLVTNTDNVFIFNLEDQIRQDLLNGLSVQK
jgi:regulator of protease activity HflC (stomatin/prohibitin superfamily)/drug/metabolite transporter superfamily protein YnfA